MRRSKCACMQKVNLLLVWAGVYFHLGVHLRICKYTFAYKHDQNYIQVQILHIMQILHTVSGSAHVNVVKEYNINAKFSTKWVHLAILVPTIWVV